MNRLNDPYEQTPEDFHLRVEQTLGKLVRVEPPKRYARRLVLITAIVAVVLVGTAVALNQLGVLYFLNERWDNGEPAVEENVIHAARQSCDGTLMTAEVRDAYWNGTELSLCVHVAPVQADKYALLSEDDIGVDGETFDKIWWKGDVLSFDEWLPEGKEMLLFTVDAMRVGKANVTQAYDWVPDEQGETYLLQGDLWRLDDAHYLSALNADGTLTVTVSLNCHVGDTTETVTLTADLPAPTMEEWRNLKDA